jgi:hypothetical protein
MGAKRWEEEDELTLCLTRPFLLIISVGWAWFVWAKENGGLGLVLGLDFLFWVLVISRIRLVLYYKDQLCNFSENGGLILQYYHS